MPERGARTVPDHDQAAHCGAHVAAAVERRYQPGELGHALAATGMHEKGGRHVRRLGGRNLADGPGQPVGAGVAECPEGDQDTAEQIVARRSEPGSPPHQARDRTGQALAAQPGRKQRYRRRDGELERVEQPADTVRACDDLGLQVESWPQRPPPAAYADPGVAELDPAISHEGASEVGRQRSRQHERRRQAHSLGCADAHERHPFVVGHDVDGGAQRADDPGRPGRAFEKGGQHGRGRGEPGGRGGAGRR